MKKLILTILAIPILLAGCGQTQNKILIGPDQAVWAKPAWISVSSAGNPTKYYVVTGKTVSHVKKPFAVLDSASQGPVGWGGSSTLPAGTELYLIPGVDFHKAIAVKLENGMYIGADYVGTKHP